MMSMLYWMFHCLFSPELDYAVDLNMKVKFWTHMAIFLLKATGKLAQESIV